METRLACVVDTNEPPAELSEGQVREIVGRMGVDYKPTVVLVIIGGRMYKREDKTFYLLDDKPRRP